MPSISRRRLLGGGAVIATGAYGTSRLHRGATDATFESWTTDAGTWPLRRYDPANTAYNPNASPPRETPTPRELASLTATAKRPTFFPLVGTDRLAVYGSGVATYPRDGGRAVHAADAPTPLAGFGPGGRLHAVRLDPSDGDAPSALVGIDAEEGRETYRHPLDADNPSGVAVGASEVYVGGEDGTLRAVDPASSRRWRVDGAKPALVGGCLYAADSPLDGTVAYAERSGFDRRLEVGPERIWSTGSESIRGFSHAPAVADGRLVLGSYQIGGGAVVAFDVDTGDRLWEPRSLGADVATPAVVGDRGYTAVGTDDREAGLVAALNLATGEVRWRDELPWHAFSPVVADDTFVVAGEVREGGERTAGKVRAYDAVSGDVLWTRTFETRRLGGLALVDDRVLVTTESSLYELV